MDLSSLVDAKLAWKLDDGGGRSRTTEGFARMQAQFKGLLSSFVHVNSLEVGTWAIQVLPIMEAKGLSSPLLHCTSLTLETCLTNDAFPGIASMLEISPNLETLFINDSYPPHDELYSWPGKAELCNFKAEHYWTSQERTFKCLSLHLKKVVFADLSWYSYESHFYYFAQFLLKNAKVLQKMIICTLWLEDSVPKEIFEASKKLLGFPRTSPEAIVMFHKNPMAKWNISTFTPPPWDNCFE